MRILTWLVRGFIFFTLFAFALNNQQEVDVTWFFGAKWRSPLVIVVLAAFAAGIAMGVLAMVPRWWRNRRMAQRQAGAPPAPTPAGGDAATTAPSDIAFEHPPREGL